MDTGDTAWILASSALVLLMTPGLAFFYGGMVRAKSVLNMMMMSFIALAIVPVLWVLYGYSFAFSPGGNRWLGGFERLGLDGVSAAQVELRNTDDPGTLPRGPFSIASSDCEAALASAPTELTCTVAVTVAPDAQNIAQAGEVAYAFRPSVTDAAGNSTLALSWGYLVVQPQ